MAINSKTLMDENGEYSDWIEIYNPGETAVNLDGWFLTDKADNLRKWEFPAISIKADEYLVVFASEKKRTDPGQSLHTNFKLSGSGEFLAIVEPDGITVSHSFGENFPAQKEDISFGLFQQQNIFFDLPTPGLPNILSNQPVSPIFNVTRNFFSSPFDVTLTTVGEGEIYYTLDGTRPTKITGTLYQQPIHIQTTTPLSAVTINSAGSASEIITQTYLFTDSIVKQPVNPDGYPANWGRLKFKNNDAPADYEMDPEICNNPDYKDLMNEALKSIPTLSIVTNPGYLFSHEKNSETGGIYIFTGNSGDGGAGMDWERPASVEYFDPATSKQFQINCGLRLHGGNSRIPDNSAKHSFRLSFRSIYGPSKLKFRLFEEETAVNEFNSLVLRAGYNYSYMTNVKDSRKKAQFLRDPFAKNTQQAIGQVSAHQKFVHLYLNGLYWGLYNVSEKLTNDFMEAYLKGKEDDFDVIKDHGGVVDGYWTNWSKLYNQAKAGLSNNTNYQKVQGKNPDGTINPSYDNLLDIENLIGYMQYNIYIGNIDWDHNNWIAARNRVSNNAGFRFFCWDAETSLTDVNVNIADENNEENPSWFYQLLQENEDFRVLFADHIQRNFFNGGPLTPEASNLRYTNLANEIDLAIIAESARWGDYRKDVLPSDNDRILYTRNDHWLPQKEYLLKNYFPYRTEIVVQQFRDIGLFPNIEAPVFSHEGGEMSSSINLGMTSNYGEIYYTTDGSDPRELITSNIETQARLFTGEIQLSKDVLIKARAKSGSEWSPITTANFNFDDSTPIAELTKIDNINSGNYPNPFTDYTKIFFSLPSDGNIQLDVISIDGRLVKNLLKGMLSSGYHEIEWNSNEAKTGVYLYRINYNGENYFGKIIRN